jgi:hypothetical protein
VVTFHDTGAPQKVRQGIKHDILENLSTTTKYYVSHSVTAMKNHDTTKERENPFVMVTHVSSKLVWL